MIGGLVYLLKCKVKQYTYFSVIFACDCKSCSEVFGLCLQCIMHLEDRLQEMYLKSKMLSEYLRGHTRVHVKELGIVLGIESNDLPLLAAIASTHSPYVAQILL